MVPLLNPFSSQQFLIPCELEAAAPRWRTTGESFFFLSRPPKTVFVIAHLTRRERGEQHLLYIQSPEQVSVRAELISRALIIGYDGRQVVGRNGSKRQEVNNKGCPHPLSLHTPPEAIL